MPLMKTAVLSATIAMASYSAVMAKVPQRP